ncbi:hypothetical protein ACKVM9_002425 [Pantoea agglomerans]|uniref:hypothetical protein n=1 Tax=Enterobacter agglomerans TaxID=549 RepID=UPI0027933A88|nr:hypothetical protein [Pantoea agglomerans]MDQ0548202.1 hypothetical protein [Pantoea agglomerans]
MQLPEYRRRGNQLTLGRRWSPDEIGQLKELAATTPPKLIARQLNRSYESVRQRASRSRIRFLEERSKGRSDTNPNL